MPVMAAGSPTTSANVTIVMNTISGTGVPIGSTPRKYERKPLSATKRTLAQGPRRLKRRGSFRQAKLVNDDAPLDEHVDGLAGCGTLCGHADARSLLTPEALDHVGGRHPVRALAVDGQNEVACA
jgi:hypothetical protein